MGRKRLYNVLRGISAFYKQMGYCQGLNYIAAAALSLVDEETAFWLMKYFLDMLNLQSIVSENLPNMDLWLYKL